MEIWIGEICYKYEVVKAKNNFLVTAHFGIAFDAGCISVRKINSPVDLPVIFAIYEVIYLFLCVIFAVQIIIGKSRDSWALNYPGIKKSRDWDFQKIPGVKDWTNPGIWALSMYYKLTSRLGKGSQPFLMSSEYKLVILERSHTHTCDAF